VAISVLIVEELDATRVLKSDLPSADILVLPEYSLGRIRIEELKQISKDFAALARVVVPGSGIMDNRNVAPIIVEGEVVAYSEKLFPSRATGERLRIAPGRRLAVVEVSGLASIGVVICLDAFYPETVRALALSGAEIVVNPSKISSDRVGTWRAVGIARAFENSIWFIGVNAKGIKYRDGREVSGGSFAAGPNSEFLEPSNHPVAIDVDSVKYTRSRRGFLLDAVKPEMIDVVRVKT